ncbi:transposase [Streptomyces sp. BG9H]|uniref:Transposase n=1 Tax=Streptomyces anatolicus TaxID=2675858 RepID=A0ABS6YKR4_9ACTN|nr:transposase [Streptomyces anatolicus]
MDQVRGLAPDPRPVAARGQVPDGHLPQRGGHGPRLPVGRGIRHRRQAQNSSSAPAARRPHPELAIVWADSAYRGPFTEWARSELKLTIKTVSKPKEAKGCIVQPRRWIVERSWGWVMHTRRLVRDHERLPKAPKR